MKAAANGALNLSILDGWWPEAYNGSNGWAIGSGEEFEDPDYQDKVDSTALYELLENEVVPRFFDRGPDGLPHAWIDMIKNSMATICVRFNSHRMIEDYMNDYYIQAGLAHQVLGETRLSRARELRDWKQKVRSQWKDVKILDVSLPQGDRVALGDELEVNATIQLGGLRDEEVIVDLTHGLIGQDGNQLAGRDITAMRSNGKVAEGVWRFTGTIPCDETGVYGYGIRVLPFHPYLFSPLSMNLLTLG